jgi:GLPGLI family protein
MKKIIIIILISLVFIKTNYCQSLEVEVVYQKALKKINDKTKSNPKILKGLNYFLQGNKSASIFKFEKKLQLDNGVNKRFISRGGGGGLYYKNIKDSVRLEQKETIDGELYLISHKFKKYNWKLSKDSKNIGKYLCYKATANYTEYNSIKKKNINFNIVAWYTPEISFPYGPSGYDGLPGLVLETKNGGFYFIASKVKITSNISKISPPKKGIKVTLKEFNEIILKKMENIFGKNFYEKNKKKKN